MFVETKIRTYKNYICVFAEDQYYLKPGKKIRLWYYQKEILKTATKQNGERSSEL